MARARTGRSSASEPAEESSPLHDDLALSEEDLKIEEPEHGVLTHSVAPQQSARFTRLVSDHLDFLWRALRRFGVRDADVDDATQRVFLIANEKLPRIEIGRERSFLVGVATRIAAHARRSYQRRDFAESQLFTTPPGDNPNPEELTEQLQARMLLDRVLDRMPEELRIVFVLFELEELTVDEITNLLGLPRGTVATRLRRSREVFHENARSLAAQRAEGRKHG